MAHLWLVASVGLLAAGCQPDIGEECTTSVDCSTLGERLCDTTQPGGYCTIFNCEPDTCPDEATCVAFYLQEDPACGPLQDGLSSRFARSFCMYTCEEQGDCRDGYECIRPSDRLAFVIDTDTNTDNPQDEHVCMAPGSLAPMPPEVPGRCTPADDGPPLVPWTPATGGSGGTAGTGGSGGTAGTGGSGGTAGTGGSGGTAGTGGSGGTAGTGGSGGTAGTGGSSGTAGAGGG